jgi:hypothetical protein
MDFGNFPGHSITFIFIALIKRNNISKFEDSRFKTAQVVMLTQDTQAHTNRSAL